MHQRQLPHLAAAALSIFIVSGSAGASGLRASPVTEVVGDIGSRTLMQLGATALRSVQAADPVNMPQPNTGQTLPDAARAEEIRGQKGLGMATIVIGTVVVVAAVWGLVAFVLRRTWAT